VQRGQIQVHFVSAARPESQGFAACDRVQFVAKLARFQRKNLTESEALATTESRTQMHAIAKSSISCAEKVCHEFSPRRKENT
jgi:hypothetical protein